MASVATLVCVLESPGAFVEFDVPLFKMVLEPPAPMLVAIRGNSVDSRLFRCGSVKSTLVPYGLSATSLSCAIEFLKRSSSLDCMA